MKRARLWPQKPWAGARSRLVWSVIPALLTAWWVLGNLAGEVTVFSQMYTFPGMLKALWSAGVWKSAMSSMSGWSAEEVLMRWGWLALLITLWTIVVFVRGLRTRRVVAILFLAASAWPFFFMPLQCVLAPLISLQAVFATADGETYQDWGLQFGTLAPWGVLGSLCVVYSWLERPPAGVCRTCGYSLAGLTTAVCPECGTGKTKLPTTGS